MARAVVLAIAMAIAFAGAAVAATFHGAAVEDEEMTLTLRVSEAGVVRFDYVDVEVECSNGDRIREPGGEHTTTLGERARFSDMIEQDLGDDVTGSSFVKGRIHGRSARGIVVYDLRYEGGACHSGKVHWTARRKNFSRDG